MLVSSPGTAQVIQLSPEAELSVITCGPGTDELYATFGHSAFRVLDEANALDRVYNYGTFDFNTPNFYTKFARGKLLYQLSAYDFGRFLQSYHRENRWVKAQVLDLSTEEVQEVFAFLETNALPENRKYKYDFFYDNCSTKIFDVIEEVIGDKILYNSDFSTNKLSHRELIDLYTGTQPWGDFGIDLALGADIDRPALNREYMFLPDYIYQAFVEMDLKTEDGSKPIVKRNEEILLSEKQDLDDPEIGPFQVTSFVLLLILFVTFLDHRKEKRNRLFDSLLFIITGAAGLVLLLLWFATDHTATANNFNILWAFAPNLVFAFIAQRYPKMSYWYVITLLLLLDIMLALWIFRIQVFHTALIPLIIGLYVRYIYLWRYFGKLRKGLLSG